VPEQIKWLWAFLLLWLFVSIVGGITTMTQFGTEQVSALEAVMTFKVFDFGGALLIFNKDWLNAFGTMVTWDFGMFEGSFAVYVKYFLWTISAAFVFIPGGAWLAARIRGG